MNESAKELTAIGASFAARYQPCLIFHVDKAKILGIRDKEIIEAISVGRMIQRGAMLAMTEFVEGIPNGLRDKPSICCSSIMDNCCH